MDIVSHIGEKKGGDASKPQPKIHTKYIRPKVAFKWKYQAMNIRIPCYV